MNISVFGLGYVGTVSAACFAQQNHQVIGVDINSQKVKIIDNGRSPVIERDIDEIISESVSAGLLCATEDAYEAIMGSDLSFICVGTPSNSNGSLDLSYVTRVCNEIGRALKDKAEFHIVVLRSTVLPGTTQAVVIPALQESSRKIAGQDFGFIHNPEFLREGTAVYDFYHPPFTVIGAQDQRSAEVIKNLYEGLEAPVFTVPVESAEMIKYTCNAFHALKVSFANEIGNICKKHNIDSHQIMDIFCEDDQLNLSPYYLKPGYAFGGSCLPKDLRALLYHGHREDLSLPVLEAILRSNELQIKRGVEMVRETGKKKIGVLGFSFKAGTDDLRESPLVEMIEILLGKGYQIRIYDRNVSLARLYGSNKAYIEREIPHISSLMCDSIEDVLAFSEVIVIGNNDAEFGQIPNHVNSDQKVIDLVRIEKIVQHTEMNYEGICW